MSVRVEKFDLAECVTAVVESQRTVATEAGLELVLQVPERQILARSDSNRIAEILLNLVSNALKFTESGTVAVSLSVEGDEARLAVADTGPGIPPDELERIFDEYRRVHTSGPKVEGVGLGLAISAGLAGLLGGRITVDSEIGEGSTFRFSFPLEIEAT
jgi:signal transduction histidine kinase